MDGIVTSNWVGMRAPSSFLCQLDCCMHSHIPAPRLLRCNANPLAPCLHAGAADLLHIKQQLLDALYGRRLRRAPIRCEAVGLAQGGHQWEPAWIDEVAVIGFLIPLSAETLLVHALPLVCMPTSRFCPARLPQRAACAAHGPRFLLNRCPAPQDGRTGWPASFSQQQTLAGIYCRRFLAWLKGCCDAQSPRLSCRCKRWKRSPSSCGIAWETACGCGARPRPFLRSCGRLTGVVNSQRSRTVWCKGKLITHAACCTGAIGNRICCDHYR